MWRSGRPWDCDAGSWRARILFEGGSSSSSSSQATSSEDNRVGADNGAIVAQGGSDVHITSSNPAVVIAALQSVEHASTTNAEISGTVALNATNAGAAVGMHGIDAGATIAGQGIDAGRQVASQALTVNEQILSQVLGLAQSSVNTVASEATNAQALAQGAIDTAAPATAGMKQLIVAGTIVLVVFFLSRAKGTTQNDPQSPNPVGATGTPGLFGGGGLSLSLPMLLLLAGGIVLLVYLVKRK